MSETVKTCKISLRPHHLLCLQKFTGHGYNEEFTEHMTSVVSGLAHHPETEILLIDSADELCEKCPHNIDSSCTSLDKVSEMDRRVNECCSFKFGKVSKWNTLARTAREMILSTDKFDDICGSCQWFELCKNTK